MLSSLIRFQKRATDLGHYWTAPVARAMLRQHLVGQNLSFFKEASIGGEQESGFEQAFSSLAYAYVKDKSPRLLDYMVGFQLVDRNEDNTKAMGLFGFRVGDQWLYGPVFFLNGDLKGHELLYIKNQDAFVPMKENWVNYLISRKPHRLGEGSSRNTWELGGLPPDIMRLTMPPSSGKYGSDAYRPLVQEWARPFLPFLGACAVKDDSVLASHTKVAQALDLRHVLRHPALASVAIHLASRYPLIKSGFDRFYGKNFFPQLAVQLKEASTSIIAEEGDTAGDAILRSQAIDDVMKGRTRRKPRKRAGDSLLDPPKETHPLKTGALRVLVRDRATLVSGSLESMPKEARNDLLDSILGDDAPNLEDLLQRAKESADTSGPSKKINDAPGGFTFNKDEPETDEEREKLLHDGVLIKDKRDPHGSDVSVAYNTQVRMELQNPGETGIYEVLEKPGTFERMLVVMHPHTNKGRQAFATVVRLSDPRNWLNTHASNLWTKVCHCPADKDWKEWFDKLGGIDSLTKDGHYIAIGPNGASTTPFRVQESYDDKKYSVDFKDYTSWGDRPRDLGRIAEDNDQEGFHISSYNARLWVNDRPGAGLRSVTGELAIPGNFKILKLQDPPPPPSKKDPHSIICCHSPMDEGSDRKPIRPGNLVDVQMMILEKTAALKLVDTGTEVVIKSPLGQQRLQKKAALVSLVKDHLFTEVAAREMLTEAARKGSASYRVKYAQPNMSVLSGGPGAPAFPQPLMGTERTGPNAVPAIYPQEEFTQIPELMAGRTDPSVYDPFLPPDPQAMMVAQQASQSGQKEVFDTAMISGMLKAVRQDSLVDKYLGDIMKCLDKLGRILFMFYWHQEEFEDRYGKQDLPELEDTCRNAFEVLGDLALFLKEKQVGSMEEMQGVGNPEPDIKESARN